MDRALSGATTPGQSGPGSDGDEVVVRIPQSSSIAWTSPSYCLVSYPGHSLGGGLTPLQRCSQCILQPQQTGQECVYVSVDVCTCVCGWMYIYTHDPFWLHYLFSMRDNEKKTMERLVLNKIHFL